MNEQLLTHHAQMTLSQAPSLDIAASLPELEGWTLDDLWGFDNIVL